MDCGRAARLRPCDAAACGLVRSGGVAFLTIGLVPLDAEVRDPGLGRSSEKWDKPLFRGGSCLSSFLLGFSLAGFSGLGAGRFASRDAGPLCGADDSILVGLSGLFPGLPLSGVTGFAEVTGFSDSLGFERENGRNFPAGCSGLFPGLPLSGVTGFADVTGFSDSLGFERENGRNLPAGCGCASCLLGGEPALLARTTPGPLMAPGWGVAATGGRP